MADEQDSLQRAVLPILDQPYVGLAIYDAKDPDAEYPPIRVLRPPKGALPVRSTVGRLLSRDQ